MDLFAKMEENQRKFDKGEINKKEFNERRKLILDGITNPCIDSGVSKPKETDLYAILQLDRNATETDIKYNYRKLALKHHPDKNDGTEIEEWNKILKAYQILSDKNSRYLYDNYGTLSDSFEGKVSLNSYVGGDPWQPYIGNLEIGLWLFSFKEDVSSPELKNITTTEQKEYRHTVRISNIVSYLQNKLVQFPKQGDSSEFESFERSLHQEAQKLCLEPNGKELLSFLGKIYISKAQSHLNKYSMSSILIQYSRLTNNFKFTVDLISGFLTVKSKNGLNQDEISKVIWRLSRTEILSIAHETCDKILNDKNHSDLNHLAGSLFLLGKVWLKVSKQSEM